MNPDLRRKFDRRPYIELVVVISILIYHRLLPLYFIPRIFCTSWASLPYYGTEILYFIWIVQTFNEDLLLTTGKNKLCALVCLSFVFFGTFYKLNSPPCCVGFGLCTETIVQAAYILQVIFAVLSRIIILFSESILDWKPEEEIILKEIVVFKLQNPSTIEDRIKPF